MSLPPMPKSSRLRRFFDRFIAALVLVESVRFEGYYAKSDQFLDGLVAFVFALFAVDAIRREW